MIIGLIGILVALFVVLPLVFVAVVMLMAVFSGVAVLLTAGIFAWKGILPGIVLGFIAYRSFRKIRASREVE